MRAALLATAAITLAAFAGACGHQGRIDPPPDLLHDGTYAASDARDALDDCALGGGLEGEVFPIAVDPDEIAIRIGDDGLAEGKVTGGTVVATGEHLISWAPEYDCVVEEQYQFDGTVTGPDAWDAIYEVNWSWYSGTQCTDAIGAHAGHPAPLPCTSDVTFHLSRIGPMPVLATGTASIAAGNVAPLGSSAPAANGTGFAFALTVGGTSSSWAGVPAGAWQCRQNGAGVDIDASLAEVSSAGTASLSLHLPASSFSVGPHALGGDAISLAFLSRDANGVVDRRLAAYDGILWIDSAGSACAVHTSSARMAGSAYPSF